MLDSIGLTIPPCGLPLSDGWWVHSSQYPAFRAPSINRRKRLSWMFSCRMCIRMVWSIFSNDRISSYPCQQPTSRRPDGSRGHRSHPSALRAPLCAALDPPAPPQRGLYLRRLPRHHGPPSSHQSVATPPESASMTKLTL